MRPSIVLGPGARLQPLAGVLSGLGWAVRPLYDWADLAPLELDGPIEVLVDAASTPQEDLGFLRRCLQTKPTARVTVLGEDAGTRVAKSLLALPRVRWMSWPPDLNDILSLTAQSNAREEDMPSEPALESRTFASTNTYVAASTPVRNAEARPSPAPRPDARRAADHDEIARIQSILEGESESPAEPAPSAASAPGPASAAGTPRVHESAPAWWRAQVADLADAAQRIELGAQAVRNENLEPDVAEQVDALDAEIARLVQFARTIGYVAAPPARGEQTFNLAEMVQRFVHDLANRPEAAPRVLFRAPADVWVRSDRMLLTQVFDALFWLAGACAKAGEQVRAQVRREGDTAEARIEFPAGPLAGLEVARIVEPYALRRVMPELGPNALSAAQGILSGQGGRGTLERGGNGRLEWILELPAVEPNAAEAAPAKGKREPAR